MAYPAYDTYNNQVGFPAYSRSMSYHPTEYAYSDGVLGSGPYSDVSIMIDYMHVIVNDASVDLFSSPTFCLFWPSTQPLRRSW